LTGNRTKFAAAIADIEARRTELDAVFARLRELKQPRRQDPRLPDVPDRPVEGAGAQVLPTRREGCGDGGRFCVVIIPLSEIFK
jgi:hypothetical protein